VPVGGGGLEATERLRARVAGGRPNWWVILAVSLALMALLVATAGAPPDRPRSPSTMGEKAAGDAHQAGSHGPSGSTRVTGSPGASSTTTTTAAAATTTTSTLPPPSDTVGSTALVAAHGSGHTTSPTTTPGVVTPTTVATTTTTTTAGATSQAASLPADRMQTQGYLDPPVQTSNVYGFTGAGATDVSVVWSGDTYLTMTVSCADGSQSVGGTSAMEASLPNAQGSCQATVEEPASESTSLTYSITIGPAGE
jgi:hypothetical protein